MNLQLRDHGSGHRVEFRIVDDTVRIVIDVPDESAAADRLLASTSSGQSDIWRVSRPEPIGAAKDRDEPGSAPIAQVVRELCAEFRWSDARDEDASAMRGEVLRVMREGLGMRPEQLRYSVWNSTGPISDRWGGSFIAPERPTLRGAPEICLAWDDFTERLEWVLTTLPAGGLLTLRAPRMSTQLSRIQFAHERVTMSQATLYDFGSLGFEAGVQRMVELGWKHAPRSVPGVRSSRWIVPGELSSTCTSKREAAIRACHTLHSVLGVAEPMELSGHVVSRRNYVDCDYVYAELGVLADPD